MPLAIDIHLAIYAAAVCGIVSFLIALRLFRVVEVSAGAVEISRGAAKSIYDSALNDEDKERILQKAALRLLGTFVSIVVRGSAAMGASFATLYLLQAIGLTRFSEVLDLLTSWKGFATASVTAALAYVVWIRH